MATLGRAVTLTVWRQCSPKRRLLQVDDPASYRGRFHRVGDAATWYSSLTTRDAWAQLFRHTSGGVDTFEVKRRIGHALVSGLVVLDLTDKRIRRAVGIRLTELRSNNHAECQKVAREARAAGLEGILAPSAALRAETTLVVFDRALKKIAERDARIETPPERMRAVRRRIRRAPWA